MVTFEVDRNKHQVITVLNSKILEIKACVAANGNILSPVYAKAITMLADAIITGANEEIGRKPDLKIVK